MKPPKHLWQAMPMSQAEPLTMHVDMNSCFATMEQQANPLLRGRPIAVVAYASPWGCIIAPSIEAKQQGVKTGMRVRDGQALCADLVIVQSHPPLYRDAHLRFKRIFESYTSAVTPLSIDEAVIDFRGSQVIKHKSMVDIGYEIKRRVHDEIGEWVRVNVGIAPNRFLAKTAAGLHKPDGLDVITHDNLRAVYAGMTLLDITGINYRNQARLNLWGIRTPLEFLDAPIRILRKLVFEAITGYYWHLRMRGWEVDAHDWQRRTIGHNYTLQDRTNQTVMLPRFLMKLCEKVGRRLRANSYVAKGVHVWVMYEDGDFWHKGMLTGCYLYTTKDIYFYADELLKRRSYGKTIVKMGVTTYALQPFMPEQINMFAGQYGDEKALSRALDAVNDRYGDMVVGSALLANMGGFVLDRIAFGGVKDLHELYETSFD
ncbi:MAG: DNA polymerase IV [Candidatus Saccharimonadales bacterium]